MTVYIMQDGLLDINIKPKDLVLGKTNTVFTRVFVVLTFVPPNILQCLACDNRIKTLYMNKLP
jgi:hypothetical protein